MIQRTASELGYIVTDEEMFKTFNMGWGFGIIVDEIDVDKAIRTLSQGGMEPERIGEVTDKERVVEIKYAEKRMILS